MNNLIKSSIFLLAIIVSACTSPPKGIKPIHNFRANDYLGTWYEIMRLDHPFERGLSNVTAHYSLRDDNNINVLNKGFNEEKCELKEARGIAKFIQDKSIGSLAVSFFRPIYGGYHIIAIDEKNYSYAMVTGSNRKYLWILSRKSSLEEEVLTKLINKANTLGFKTDELIKVKHNEPKKCF